MMKEIKKLSNKSQKTSFRIDENKWPKNHLSRSIDTWYYDHLINPYAGIDWQIDSTRLIIEAAKYGFILQSSCPNYIDKTEVNGTEF